MSLSLMAVLAGCGETTSQGQFERQVNANYNAQEMSRSHGDPGYIPRYDQTMISP
jgi:hypothetical protein